MKILLGASKLLGIAIVWMLVLPISTFAQTKVVVIPMAGDTEESNWRGPWEAGSVYELSDVVEEGGSSYLSLQDLTSSLSNIPPADGYWATLAAAGFQGPTGPQGAAGPPGSIGLPGQKAMMVTRESLDLLVHKERKALWVLPGLKAIRGRLHHCVSVPTERFNTMVLI